VAATTGTARPADLLGRRRDLHLGRQLDRLELIDPEAHIRRRQFGKELKEPEV
jgi:hypothetical protein